VFYLSLEDDLMRLFGSDRIARWMDRTGAEEGEVITHPWVTSAIGQAQKRVELQNFQARKRLLEYDDVMNQQREVIYSLRRFALEGGEELKAEARHMIDAAVRAAVARALVDAEQPAAWDRAAIEAELLQALLLSVPGVRDPAVVRDRDDLIRAAQDAGRTAFQAKLDYFKELEEQYGAPPNIGGQALAHVMLGVIDEKWKDHLYDLDQLRAAIQYRAWGQKDPLIEYKQEAFEMFQGLMHDLESTFTDRWLKLQIQLGPPAGQPAPRGRTATGPLGAGPRRLAPTVATKADADGLVSAETATGPRPPRPPAAVAAAPDPYAGVGRNDPCPCGSGKKFKKCHGAAV
jgi:preprotein translocase subunit SecA